MSALSLVAAHESFTAALLAVENQLQSAFRRLRPQDREDAVAEARAATWSAWAGLLKQGKDPVAVGVTGIAHNAVRYVKNGRRVGNRNAGRGAMDVYHRKAQEACGFRVVSLDSQAEYDARPARNVWRDWLAEDNRVTPADEACFRLDFGVWLAGLPARKRKMAELLAEGHETGVVAQTVGVSNGRVSQMRSESWRRQPGRAFQGEDGGNRDSNAAQTGPDSRLRDSASPVSEPGKRPAGGGSLFQLAYRLRVGRAAPRQGAARSHAQGALRPPTFFHSYQRSRRTRQDGLGGASSALFLFFDPIPPTPWRGS